MLLSRPHAPVDDAAVPGSGAISFEAAVVDCPSVVRCFLMSGSDDYIVIVMARDIEDFERHPPHPNCPDCRGWRGFNPVSAMREVVNRAVPPVIFAGSRRRARK